MHRMPCDEYIVRDTNGTRQCDTDTVAAHQSYLAREAEKAKCRVLVTLNPFPTIVPAYRVYSSDTLLFQHQSAAHAHQVRVIGAAQGFFLRSAHVFYKIFRALQSETVYIVVRFRMDTSVFGVQG